MLVELARGLHTRKRDTENDRHTKIDYMYIMTEITLVERISYYFRIGVYALQTPNVLNKPAPII